MIIRHNIDAIKINNKLGANNSKSAKNLEKLASGLMINRSADNSAGLGISEKMRAQIRGLEMADQNIHNGLNLVQVGDLAMQEIDNINHRLRELSVQASNGTYEGTDRAAIQKEADALMVEIDRIADYTNFNGINMLNGTQPSGNKPGESGPGFIGPPTSGGVGSIVDDELANGLGDRVTYGGSGNDTLGNVYFGADGTAVFCGGSTSNDIDVPGNNGGNDGWITKVGKDGNVIWSTNVGAGTYENLGTVVATNDGGYLSGGNKNGIAYLVKLDTDGNVEWEYATGKFDENINGLMLMEDGTVVASVQTYSNDNWKDPNGNVMGGPSFGGRDTVMISIDPSVNPNTDYSNSFKKVTRIGGAGNEQLQKLAPTTYEDGTTGFIAAGYTTSNGLGTIYGNGHHRAWIVSFNMDGTIRQQISFGDSANVNNDGEMSEQIIQTSDGGYLLVGRAKTENDYTHTFPPDPTAQSSGTSFWMLKLDKDLKPSWTKNFGSTAEDAGARCVVETEDGYVIAGSVARADGDVTGATKGGTEACIIKIDKQGNLLWDQIYGGSGNESFQYMYQTTSGDILIAGTSSSNDSDLDGHNKGGNDAWFLKISSVDGTPVTGGAAGIPGLPPNRPGVGGDDEEIIRDIILQVGANNGDQFTIVRADVRTNTLYGKPPSIDLTSIDSANDSIELIDQATKRIANERGRFGTYENALGHILSNVSNTNINLTDAESRIRDADMAKEMMEFTKSNILLQASQAMLSQANTTPQRVLSLLQ